MSDNRKQQVLLLSQRTTVQSPALMWRLITIILGDPIPSSVLGSHCTNMVHLYMFRLDTYTKIKIYLLKKIIHNPSTKEHEVDLYTLRWTELQALWQGFVSRLIRPCLCTSNCLSTGGAQSPLPVLVRECCFRAVHRPGLMLLKLVPCAV